MHIGDANAASVRIGGHANSLSVSIGGANTSVVDIGTGSANKTISIGSAGDTVNIGDELGPPYSMSVVVHGDLTVRGIQHVIGDTTFDESIVLGDGAGDPITVNGTMSWNLGKMGGAIPFSSGGTRGLTVDSAAAQGTSLTLSAGSSSGSTGGNVVLTPGSGVNSAACGDIVFGQSGAASANAYQILANTGVSPSAGLRYDNLDAVGHNTWQIRYDGDSNWYDVLTTNNSAQVPVGAAGDILQFSGSVWYATNPSALHGAHTTFGFADGDSQWSITLAGQTAESENAAGGAVSLLGGGGSTGGAVQITGGSGATAGGNVAIAAGTASTGNGGNLTLAAGAAGGGGTSGLILIGNSGTSSIALGATNTWSLSVPGGLLGASGAANINLPNNASARFQIQSAAVSANVTAANLGTLTAGVTSDAAQLHTHSAVPVPTSGETGTVAVGDVVYIDSSDNMAKSQADGTAEEAVVVGVKVATNAVAMTGVATCNMETGTATQGSALYLADTAGKVSHAAPPYGFVTFVGTAKTASATPLVYLQPARPVDVRSDLWTPSMLPGLVIGWEGSSVNNVVLPGPVPALVDGNMETAGVGAWTSYATTTPVKDTSIKHSGTQSIRQDWVSGNGGIYQNVLTTGLWYRVRGWCRGDGNAYMDIYMGAQKWIGTASTDWQYFDVVTQAGDTQLQFRCLNMAAGRSVWVDDVTVECISASRATDNTGLGRHIEQATDINRPGWVAQGTGGVLRFDGVSDSLKTANFTLNQPVHGFIVAKWTSTGTYARLIDGKDANFGSLLTSAGGGPNVTLTAGGAGVTKSLVDGAWHIIDYVLDGVSSKLAQDAGAFATGDAGALNPGGLTLCTGGHGFNPARADVFAVYQYNRELQAGERTQMADYLKIKAAAAGVILP